MPCYCLTVIIPSRPHLDIVSITFGQWPANNVHWPCTKTPHTNGFTKCRVVHDRERIPERLPSVNGELAVVRCVTYLSKRSTHQTPDSSTLKPPRPARWEIDGLHVIPA